MKYLTLLIFSIFLSACATTEQQMFAAESNWFELGKYDGEQGFNEKSQKDLTKLGDNIDLASLDVEQYQKGYQEGLDSYCVLSNAWVLGATGQPYSGVCENRQNGWQFHENWVSGRHSQVGSL
ncbi:DUF2799 domain-containing protein [Motilimonas pumila]|uniref:DUF2799 domain-containing protein n=1 Tax=Motilimonas pumila TaxID=2303987 RepID=A0A418YCU2_9GAMM|nr:DUF2799 domain-containing protein [Motilimonas pumila]RJG42314.1 DUF2799 domain-containing protein [Motilimonas pumila]